MKIEIVYGATQQQTLVELEVAEHSCIHEVLQQALPADIVIEAVGIFGQQVEPETILQPGDRIEIYRALLMDVKAARRLVAVAQQKSLRLARRERRENSRLEALQSRRKAYDSVC